MREGSSKNMPTQKSVEMGLMRVHEATLVFPNRSPKLVTTTRITGKGQLYFVKKIKDAMDKGVSFDKIYKSRRTK
jgi:anti-repressor protein